MENNLNYNDIVALESCLNFMKGLLPKLEKALPPKDQSCLIEYKKIWQDEPFNVGWEKNNG